MSGLLEKDIRLMLQRKQALIIFLILTLFMTFTQDSAFVLSYLTFLMTIFAVSTISYDEIDNCYSFLFTLPVSRKTYVIEKYLFISVLGVIGWLFGLVFSQIAVLARGESITIMEDLSAILMIPLSVLILASIMIPIQLKFGAEKSRIAIAILGAGIFVLAYAGKLLISDQTNAAIDQFLAAQVNESSTLPLILFFLAVVLLTLASLAISMKIMDKKEF